MLKTFLRECVHYWHDRNTKLLQVVSCTSTIHSDWDLVTVRLSDLCDKLEAALRRWVHCGDKEMELVSNNTCVGCSIQSVSWKDVLHHHQPAPPSTTASLKHWYNVYAFRLFPPIIQMLQRRSWLIRPNYSFPVFCPPISLSLWEW